MTYFENALIDLIGLEEKLGSDAVDVKAGDQDCDTVIEEHLIELREIIGELRSHHTKLVYLDNMMERIGELKL